MIINRKKLIIFLPLSLVGVLLLFLVFKAFFQSHKVQTPTKKPALSVRPKETKEIPSHLGKTEGGRLKSSYSSWARNPFIPGDLADTSGRLIVKGIVWGDDEVGTFAIINDKIVKKGDEIGGKRVVEIKKDKVIINDGQNNFELKL